MTSIEKLTAKLKSKPSEIRFSEVLKIMSHFGAQEVRVSGSHHIFRKDGRSLSVPARKGDRLVSGCYVDQILDFLGIER